MKRRRFKSSHSEPADLLAANLHESPVRGAGDAHPGARELPRTRTATSTPKQSRCLATDDTPAAVPVGSDTALGARRLHPRSARLRTN